MQISSPLHTIYFSNSSFVKRVRGFTLIELLISIGIIGILTAIVIVKYQSFDSTVLLKDAAYEVALALRDAQVRSVSVGRVGSNFDYPSGVTFSVGQPYIGFQYQSSTIYPQYDGSTNVQSTGSVTLGKSMVISDICVTVGLTQSCSSNGVTRLDISFKRPEFSALYYAKKGGGDLTTTVDNAKIYLSSTINPANVFVVEVSKLGQISVSKQ